MIEYFTGNLFDTIAPIIMHGCNAQGVMGSGVALEVKTRWPFVTQSYIRYIKSMNDRGINPCGTYWPVEIFPGRKRKIIVNLITQENYGRDKNTKYANPEYIKTSIDSFLANMNLPEGFPIAIPKIGAGLGNLDWDTEVEPIIDELQRKYSVDFWVYSL